MSNDNTPIKIPPPKFALPNKHFYEVLGTYLGNNNYELSDNKFSEFNFIYLFNTPKLIFRGSQLSIRINEDIARFKWDKDFLDATNSRRYKLIEELKSSGYQVETKSLRVFWRLVLGLGGVHPQETSMILHHTCGVPYIPGSAIKGVTRHWAVMKFAEVFESTNESFEDKLLKISRAIEEGLPKPSDSSEDKYKDIRDLKINVTPRTEDNEQYTESYSVTLEEVSELFGTQQREGKVIFFDAYPSSEIKLALDIMNPHYPDYYTEQKAPADWQEPNPIKFLTVEKTKFWFILASRDARLVKVAKALMIETLLNYGIGAKTAIGYGIFK